MSRFQKLFAIGLWLCSPIAALMYLGQWRTGTMFLAVWGAAISVLLFAVRHLGLDPMAFLACVVVGAVVAFIASIVLFRRAWRVATPNAPILAIIIAIATRLMTSSIVDSLHR